MQIRRKHRGRAECRRVDINSTVNNIGDYNFSTWLAIWIIMGLLDQCFHFFIDYFYFKKFDFLLVRAMWII